MKNDEISCPSKTDNGEKPSVIFECKCLQSKNRIYDAFGKCEHCYWIKRYSGQICRDGIRVTKYLCMKYLKFIHAYEPPRANLSVYEAYDTAYGNRKREKPFPSYPFPPKQKWLELDKGIKYYIMKEVAKKRKEDNDN